MRIGPRARSGKYETTLSGWSQCSLEHDISRDVFRIVRIIINRCYLALCLYRLTSGM